MSSHSTSVPRLNEILITLRSQSNSRHLDGLSHSLLLFLKVFKMLLRRFAPKRSLKHFLCSSGLNDSLPLIFHLISELFLVIKHIFFPHFIISFLLLQLTRLESPLVVLKDYNNKQNYKFIV
jgi:hypothetical protein